MAFYLIIMNVIREKGIGYDIVCILYAVIYAIKISSFVKACLKMECRLIYLQCTIYLKNLKPTQENLFKNRSGIYNIMLSSFIKK